jgi:IS5 family transposase
MTLAAVKGFEVHGRATRKAEFLARMQTPVPWAQFCALIEPPYPKAGNGRPPVGLERMRRMYLVANWFKLGAALFGLVGELLQANGRKLSGGTIVDATLIAAPPSTKNQEQSRDPEMPQSKKGRQWHFGMKVHLGMDSQSGADPQRPCHGRQRA